MSSDVINVDDGTWEGAQELARQWAVERQRVRDVIDRHAPCDDRQSGWREEARYAEDEAVLWSAIAYERWVGSPDWIGWHEEQSENAQKAAATN